MKPPYNKGEWHDPPRYSELEEAVASLEDLMEESVLLPNSLWYRLCDALTTAPDNTPADVIHKAELLAKRSPK